MDPLVKKFLMDKYLLEKEDDNLASVPLRDGQPEAEMLPQTSPQPEANVLPQTTPVQAQPMATQTQPQQAPEMEMNLDFGKPTSDYRASADEEMREAQRRQQDELSRNNMMRGISTIGAAIAGVNPDMKFYDQMDKQAGLGVQNLKDRRAFELENIQRQQVDAKMDPDSSVSRNVREAYKQMVPKLVGQIPDFETLSAFDIEQNLAKPADLYQRAQDRRNQLEAMSGFRERRLRLQEEKARNKPTPGQSQLDKSFAKEYQQFVAGGGYADVQKQLDQLRSAAGKLKSGSYTGPIQGRVPDVIRGFTNPEAIDIRENVEEVVQRNLRLVLGAQFTEKEGERLISRAFNPKLDEEVNQVRLQRLIQQIEGAAQAKKRAVEYFEANGTLRGFKGRLPKFSDFNPEKDTSLNKTATSKKQIVKKLYSQKADKTKLIYSDGSEEVVDGRQ